MNKIRYFKLNEDDILEIVSEYVAEKTKISEFTAKSIILGTPSKDLRMIIAVDNSDLSHVDLTEADSMIDFNGEHSSVKGLNNDELLMALDNMTSTGEF